MGTNTDPYQLIEARFKVTRSVLDVLDRFGHPASITTKNHLVTRDIDVLASMARRNLILVNLSVTSLDHQLSRRMEPRASTPKRRIDAIRLLASAGIPVNVFVSPIIPGLNDHELEAILEAASAAGARGASSIHLRLPHEVKDLFETWLRETMPDRADKVLHLIRDMRGGKLNDPRFGARMKGEGPYAQMLSARFAKACARLGLSRDRFTLSTDAFGQPPSAQLSLFDF
jgi:DNA repair photolyase